MLSRQWAPRLVCTVCACSASIANSVDEFIGSTPQQTGLRTLPHQFDGDYSSLCVWVGANLQCLAANNGGLAHTCFPVHIAADGVGSGLATFSWLAAVSELLRACTQTKSLNGLFVPRKVLANLRHYLCALGCWLEPRAKSCSVPLQYFLLLRKCRRACAGEKVLSS